MGIFELKFFLSIYQKGGIFWTKCVKFRTGFRPQHKLVSARDNDKTKGKQLYNITDV